MSFHDDRRCVLVLTPANGNSPMESFYALLQTNVLDRKVWAGRDQLASVVIGWIERTCHRRRRQRGFRKPTPLEFDFVHQPAVSTAVLDALKNPDSRPW